MNIFGRFKLIFILSIFSPLMGMQVEKEIQEAMERINTAKDPRIKGFKALLAEQRRRELCETLSRCATPTDESRAQLERIADGSPFAEQLANTILAYASSDVIRVFSEQQATGLPKPIARK